jgi:hypothetical protein
VTGQQARRGCRGLEYCSKAHLLDAMEICVQIWNDGSKYDKEDSIRRCWHKARLLTVAEAAEVEYDIGCASVPLKAKVISQEDCLELRSLFTNLYCKVSKFENVPSALQESLAVETRCTEKGLDTIMNIWINIKDDLNVTEDDMMEAIEEFEKEGRAPLVPMLPSYNNLAPSIQEVNNVQLHGLPAIFWQECFNSYNNLAPSIQEVNNVQLHDLPAISWQECFNSCVIIKRFIAEKDMGSVQVAFETFQHKLRVKQIHATSSQLLIKSFFQPKQT